MEPINVTINVNVELGPKTVRVLESFLGARPCDGCSSSRAGDPAPAEPSNPIDITDSDMPDFTAAEPQPKEITDASLRQAVKAAKDRVGAKPIREVFAQMGISSSIECPQERRSELLAKLHEL